MKTVLTNGCFDVLHDGHLALLRHCLTLGDRLVVAINTDGSVHKLKGHYPATPANKRMDALQKTGLVDQVELFDSETGLVELVVKLRPDFMVKGTDYKGRVITGQRELESWGGRVDFFELVPGLSSTKAIENAGVSRVRTTRIAKGWGHELIFASTGQYAGKLLVFETGRKSSMHFHSLKDETWYVISGEYVLDFIDPVTAKRSALSLHPGDSIRVKPNNSHKLTCILEGMITEVSNQDLPDDSYRIEPGDSQLAQA